MRHLVRPQPDFPTTPGVYTWRRGEEILYIGKAKNLRNRLNSYYRLVTPEGETLPAGAKDPKRAVMMTMAETVEWIEVDTEEQALLLEAQLIKRNRPPFNSALKDDKHYPYVAITDHEYPRVFVVHRREVRDWRYYGPYTNSRELREGIDAVNALFFAPLWKGNLHRKKGNPPVSREEWIKTLAMVEGLLQGKTEGKDFAVARMKKAADEQNYDFAARLRDWIAALDHIKPRKPLTDVDSYDILGWAKNADGANLQILQMRGGHLVGQRSYTTEVGSAAAAILDAYRLEPAPAKLYMNPLPPGAELVEKGLSRPLLLARAGKLGYAKMARKNAVNTLNYVLEHERTQSPQAALKALEKALALRGLRRIECYDISNLGERHPVGAMAVMLDGVSVRRMYRRWRMEAAGQDDFDMIADLMRLRAGSLSGKDMSLSQKPDLIVIDGGPGQLSAAIDALRETDLNVPIISLAKRLEQVHLPGHAAPLDLPRDSPASRLLQRLRNETHRTAITRHRELRDAAFLQGDILSDIKGLGPKRREKLMEHFGSIENVLEASQDELEQVLGTKTADIVYRQLQR